MCLVFPIEVVYSAILSDIERSKLFAALGVPEAVIEQFQSIGLCFDIYWLPGQDSNLG
jgi:hypothetical protein